MENNRLFIDFGSTFTKAVYVDLTKNEIISRAKHPSTIDSDITEGLKACLQEISRDLGMADLDTHEALACSSAGGGLRICCVGFVHDYSSEAANLAALGAGAKVIGSYSYEITKTEIEEIASLHPDIILLTGGTDGGNKRVIIHNAKTLSDHPWPETHIIIAGNKAAYDEIREIFEEQGDKVIFTGNVMPEIGILDVGSCNKTIREIFINNIIEAKGIGRARRLIKNILMPTPSAVLEAATLLSEGYGSVEGLGELMVIDLGGATTDIHSVAYGKPSRGAVNLGGLPEPYVKRTVEGDLGLRFNVDKLIGLARERDCLSDMESIASRFAESEYFPGSEEEAECHTLLSRLAVKVATDRHAGRIEKKYGPTGEMLVQYGKDLTEIKSVIGTGGPIAYSRDPDKVLSGALFCKEEPHVLKPKRPKRYLDADYIMYAGGLMSRIDPEGALRFIKRYLRKL